MHHYEQNASVNNIVGNTPIDLETQTNKDLSKIMTAQMRVIISEARELLEGIEQQNITMIRDGLGDVVVTVDGLIHRINGESVYTDIPATLQSFYQEDSVMDGMGDEYRNIKLNLSELAFIAFDDEQSLTNRIEEATELALLTLAACYRLADHFRITIQTDQDAIYASNLSKFDTVFPVAMKGQEKYAAMGVKTRLGEAEVDGVKYYPILVAEDARGSDGRFYPTGKFLKGVNFKEPVFAALAEETAQVPA